jgi:hypothetical protein
MPSNKARVHATPNIKPEEGIVFIQSEITIPIPATTTDNHSGDRNNSTISSTKVFNVLIDTSTWPQWNRFVPKCTIRYQPTSTTTISNNHPVDDGSPLSPVLQLGTKFTLHANVGMKPETTMEASLRLYDEGRLTDVFLVIILFDEPNPAEGKPGRIVWGTDTSAKGSFPLWLLRAERIHVISEEEEEGGEGKDTEGERSGVSQRKVVRVNNWEFQIGWLAWIVRWVLQSTLAEAFTAWTEGLKEYVEKN